MLKEFPLVSILIPSFNAEKWISACVESALKQSYQNCEVIVVDDGSTDQTWEILQAFQGRVRLVRQPNLGGNVARNRLLELARGDWLQYLDADDWLGKDKIALQMDLVRSDQKMDIIYGEVKYSYMKGDEITEWHFSERTRNDSWEELVSWQLPQTGGPLWRKSAIIEVGNWKEDQPCCQEHELYLRLLEMGKTFFYGGKTEAYYRQWSDETVCRKDVSLVHRKRMDIVMRAFDHLKETKALTKGRLDAISQAVFETARSSWRYDHKKAGELRKWIRIENPKFKASGPAAPKSFQLMESLFGYVRAEQLADALRRIR